MLKALFPSKGKGNDDDGDSMLLWIKTQIFCLIKCNPKREKQCVTRACAGGHYNEDK